MWPLQVKQGDVFESETDTEVIPKLCRYTYNQLHEPIPFNEVRPAASCVSVLLKALKKRSGMRLQYCGCK